MRGGRAGQDLDEMRRTILNAVYRVGYEWVLERDAELSEKNRERMGVAWRLHARDSGSRRRYNKRYRIGDCSVGVPDGDRVGPRVCHVRSQDPGLKLCG